MHDHRREILGGTAELHWHWAADSIPRPRWWEIYMAHLYLRFECGLLFDPLEWGLGVVLRLRRHQRSFQVTVGPLLIWINEQ